VALPDVGIVTAANWVRLTGGPNRPILVQSGRREAAVRYNMRARKRKRGLAFSVAGTLRTSLP
jgi:hypothetical protein